MTTRCDFCNQTHDEHHIWTSFSHENVCEECLRFLYESMLSLRREQMLLRLKEKIVADSHRRNGWDGQVEPGEAIVGKLEPSDS